MTTAPQPAIDLAGLQHRLDSLGIGERLALSGLTIDRLFGGDEAGSGRLQHFAAGHGCTTEALDDSVVFHKAQPARS